MTDLKSLVAETVATYSYYVSETGTAFFFVDGFAFRLPSGGEYFYSSIIRCKG